MKKLSRFLIVTLGGLMALQLWATDREIDVAITPSVLVRNNNAQQLLTVHANVPFNEVDLETARLIIVGPSGNNSIILEPKRVFPDDTGDLVAKFDAAPVKNAVTSKGKKVQVVTLVFTVTKEDGSIFDGSDTVRVK